MLKHELENAPAVWVVRAGRKDEARDAFLEHGIIGIGPKQISNLKKIENCRAVYRSEFLRFFPDATRTTAANISGQLFRFFNEPKVGDVVMYVSKTEYIYLGKVVGEYKFLTSILPDFPHTRKAKWIKEIKRNDLSHELQNETRAYRAFYRINRSARVVHKMIGASNR